MALNPSGSRTGARALIAAAVVAGLIPAIALFPYPRAPRSVAQDDAAPVVPGPLAAPVRAFARPIFAPAEGDAAPVDAPTLTGIAGRLNRDAVALVRLADGSARTLAIGESVDGWRLESLAIDAALFARGRERVRVALAQDAAAGEAPAGEEAR